MKKYLSLQIYLPKIRNVEFPLFYTTCWTTFLKLKINKKIGKLNQFTNIKTRILKSEQILIEEMTKLL